MLSGKLKGYFLTSPYVGHCAGEGVHFGEAGAVDMGCLVQVSLRVNGRRVLEGHFKAFGCPFTLAVMGWLMEWVRGKTVKAVLSLDRQTIQRGLNLPDERIYAAVIAEAVLKDALNAVH